MAQISISFYDAIWYDCLLQKKGNVAMFLVGLLMLDALFMSSAHVYGKTVLSKGVSPKTYLFSINFGLFLCSIPLALFLFQFSFSWFAVLILGLSVVIRGLNLFFFAKGLNTLSAVEITSIVSLAAIFTYFYDVLMGNLTLNLFSVLFLLIIVAGCFVLAKGKVGFKEAKVAVAFTIITQIGRGILANFAMQHMNSATYLFLMAGITFVLLLPFVRYFKPTMFSMVEGIKIQVLGTIAFLLEMILAKESVTLFMLTSPAIMLGTMFVTYLVNKKTKQPLQKRQFVGAMIIVVGMALYTLTKF